jgi:hypothetical protein
MVDSKRGKVWTLDRAQGAVKAAFFAKEVLLQESDAEPRLHFSEIGALIGKNERDIGDRTLARAIAVLVAKGHLKKSGVGKGTAYTLDIPKSERVKAFARTDSAWLERVSQIGGIADGERGYAFYGVPEILTDQLRSRLRRAALKHQTVIREVLEQVWNDCADLLLKPARRRLPQKIWMEGEKAVYRIDRLMVLGSIGQGYANRLWQMLEGTIPGALTTYQKTLGISFAPETPVYERLAIAISKVGGIDRGTVEPQIERLMQRLKRDGERTQPLWDSLTQAERERAGKAVAATIALTASLTSVVHA